ncbi:MAG TPA: DUF1987 domain-containing protein [Cryomorphaceae bacterium]|nr:DUF1987 domain-containing protein [Cryomorphaceae bacterium]
MEAFIRRPTKSTPYVHLDAREGTYLLAGRSIPIDAEQFFSPILSWIDDLTAEGVSFIDFRFRFDFFNIASSKRILFILYKLADLQKNGVQVNIRWMYERFDEDMLEIGQDYSVMIDKLHFSFEEYDLVEQQEQAFAKLG